MLLKEKLSATDFSWTTGYGYGDNGEKKLERIYSHIFKAKDALVRRNNLWNTCYFFSFTRYFTPKWWIYIYYRDAIWYLIKSYRYWGNESGTLTEYGIKYDKVDLLNNKINVEKVLQKITSHTKLLAIQRSAGYSSRNCISIDEMGTAIKKIKDRFPNIVIFGW